MAGMTGMTRMTRTRTPRRVPGRSDHVVVVGAGLSGLSAALHLLGAGRRVTLLEREDGPGGRTGRGELSGYRIDTGPTVLTMPHLVDEAMAAVGRRLSEYVPLVPLHPAYHATFADGSRIAVHTDPVAMEEEVHRAAGAAEARGYRRLRTWLRKLYRAQMDTFIDANFDSPLDLLTPDLARLVALGGFGSWQGRVSRFVQDERLRRIFSFQSLYAGVAPARALAAYAVIAYMDTVAGVYFPRGGMHEVPRAMAEAARSAGARSRYRTAAAALERSPSGRVTAVHTDAGERLPCDAVVLSCELATAYRLLGTTPRRPMGLRYAPSAVVLHTGGTGDGPELGHHTLSFGHAWGRTFHELSTGALMSDPSLLITTPTATDPELAPAGRRLRYVLAPCPNLATGRHDWNALAPRYRDHLVATLRQRGLDGIGAGAEVERLVTPADWAARGHTAGTPFSAAHTLLQTGPFRPRNLPSGWENAVLAGCGTTPGVGVPTAVLSGKLAAARITGLPGRATGRPPATHTPTPTERRRPRTPGESAPAPVHSARATVDDA